MAEQAQHPIGDPSAKSFKPFVSYTDPSVPTKLYTFINADGREVVRLANFVSEELVVIARGRKLLEELRSSNDNDIRFKLHNDFRMPRDAKLSERTPSILQIRAVGLAAESCIRGVGVRALEQSSAAKILYELRRTLDPFMERPEGDPEFGDPGYDTYLIRKLNAIVTAGWD